MSNKSNLDKFIFLSPKDNLSDIIYQITHRAASKSSKDIYLPEGMYSLYNPINKKIFIHFLKQLQQQYKFQIISPDRSLVRLLENEGLQIKESAELMQSVSKQEDINPYTDFFAYHSLIQDNPVYTPPSPKQEINPEKLAKNRSTKVIPWPKFALVMTSLTLLILGLGFIFIPRASIILLPNLEEFSKDFEILFDPKLSELNEETLTIPASQDTLSLSVEGTFEATGKQTGGTQATGNIILKNETNLAQALVTNTRLRTTDGKQFRTLKEVSIPASGKVEVPIKAEEVGDSYNLESGKLILPGFESNPSKFKAIYGLVEIPISNGSSSDGTIVTEEDITQARLDLQKKLSSVLAEQLDKREGSKAILQQNTVRDIQYFDLPKVGDSKRSFTVKASGNIPSVVYQQADLEKLILALLSKQILDSQELRPDFKLRVSPNPDNLPSGVIKTRVYVNYSLQAKIDTQAIKKELRLKSPGQARDYLEDLKTIKEIDFAIYPGFLPILPALSSNIQLKIK